MGTILSETTETINYLSAHQVGNKNNGEDIFASRACIDISDERLQELLLKYFLSPFTSQEYYHFTFTNMDFKLNPLYIYATAIFEGVSDFHLNTINIAKHLYEMSNHPSIKSGDLFVAHFSNLFIGGETADAIGIFKSENRQPFLKIDQKKSQFLLEYEDGINIDKLDKGCLILNVEKEAGYKVCIVDKSNKGGEAQFWKDSFLMLRTRNDDFHQTKDFLNIAKTYVTKQYGEDFEANKTDQIEILNRSIEYFKNHDNFAKAEFEQEVFQHPQVIESFRKYDEGYRADNDIDLADTFEISDQAVKKQARIFKSVLKLDKNFHIYIHGNKEMIEQGVDPDGRKFYKIYYKNEA